MHNVRFEVKVLSLPVAINYCSVSCILSGPTDMLTNLLTTARSIHPQESYGDWLLDQLFSLGSRMNGDHDGGLHSERNLDGDCERGSHSERNLQFNLASSSASLTTCNQLQFFFAECLKSFGGSRWRDFVQCFA